MPKASKPPAPSDAPESPDVAHNIWLAGLGAWAQAQAEGNKVFEALVRDGLALQHQTQQGLAQATEKLAELTARANDARWGKLSGLFENRVAQSLARMGLPSAAEWQALQARLDQLEARLQATPDQPPPPPASPSAPAPGTPARKAATPAASPRSRGTGRRKSA